VSHLGRVNKLQQFQGEIFVSRKLTHDKIRDKSIPAPFERDSLLRLRSALH
jgi:hypothetical protein